MVEGPWGHCQRSEMAEVPKINVTYLTLDVDGTSLVIQWLRLYTPTAGGMGLIPGWGTKIPHAMQCSQ